MAKHNEIGKIGEEIAKKYLIKHNFRILEQNFNCREGEIDIICKKIVNVSREMLKNKELLDFNKNKAVTHEINDSKIYFVEVKSKKVKNFEKIKDLDKDPFSPEKNFSHEKKKRLFKAIRYYLFKNNLNLDIDCEIMLIVVYINEEEKKGKVRLYESVTLN